MIMAHTLPNPMMASVLPTSDTPTYLVRSHFPAFTEASACQRNSHTSARVWRLCHIHGCEWQAIRDLSWGPPVTTCFLMPNKSIC